MIRRLQHSNWPPLTLECFKPELHQESGICYWWLMTTGDLFRAYLNTNYPALLFCCVFVSPPRRKLVTDLLLPTYVLSHDSTFSHILSGPIRLSIADVARPYSLENETLIIRKGSCSSDLMYHFISSSFTQT